MEKRINNPSPLVEHLDGDYDGDFLGGVMANHDYSQVRTQEPEQIAKDIPIIPRSTGENALETIGPDNFRGKPEEIKKSDK